MITAENTLKSSGNGGKFLGFLLLVAIVSALCVMTIATTPKPGGGGGGNTPNSTPPVPPDDGRVYCNERGWFTVDRVFKILKEGGTIIVLETIKNAAPELEGEQVAYVIKATETTVIFGRVVDVKAYTMQWGEISKEIFFKRWDYGGWRLVKNGLDRTFEIFRYKNPADLPEGGFNGENMTVSKLARDKGINISACP